MFLGHLFEFQKWFCHHTRTNFLKFKVKRGPQTFVENFEIFDKSLGPPFHRFTLNFTKLVLV